jgi:DNA-binding MarR family transcriptional regulator
MQPLRTATSQLSDECARGLLVGIPAIMRFIRSHMRQGHQSDLTVAQFRALVFVSLNERPSLSQTAEHLGLSLPAASRMVDLLVRRRLMRRQARPEDRRRVVLSLTPRGRHTFTTAHQATQVALARTLERLSQRELARLNEAVRMLGLVFAPENHRVAGGRPKPATGPPTGKGVAAAADGD